jgi:Rad3-related DNA helicase
MSRDIVTSDQRKIVEEEAIRDLLAEMKKHRVIFLDAPAGSGKSLINLKVGNEEDSAYITTPQVPLADQYYRDLNTKFKGMGWAVKGRQNYPCLYLNKYVADKKKKKDYMADVGPCTDRDFIFSVATEGEETKVCPLKAECPYYIDRDAAMESPVSAMTFSYFWYAVWLSLSRDHSMPEEQGWGERKVLIIDEAHNLPDDLVDFFKIKLDIDEAKKLGWIEKWNRFDMEGFSKEIDPILKEMESSNGKNVQERSKRSLEKFKDYLDKYLSIESSLIVQMKEKSKSTQWAQNSKAKIRLEEREVEYIKKRELDVDILREEEIIRSLQWMRWQVGFDAGWIFSKQTDDETGKQFYEWKPFEARAFTDHYKFWQHFDNVIFSSATFFDYKGFAERLGVDDYTAVTVPETFDWQKAPIEFLSQMRLYYQERELRMPEIVSLINKISGKYPNKKGIVHCTSAKMVRSINLEAKNYPLLRKRMLFHPGEKNKKTVLDDFRKSEKGILVAVKVDEGLDFPDDDARWQIMVVVPYLNRQIPWVQAHENTDNRYNDKRALVKIMQASGRIMRNADDWGDTYVIDNRIQDLIKDNLDLLPDWFLDRVKFTEERIPRFDQWKFIEGSYRAKNGKWASRLSKIPTNFVRKWLNSHSIDTSVSDIWFYVPNWKIMRRHVIRNSESSCSICGKRFFYETGRPEVDHIKPIADGGPEFDMDNLRVVCHQCNVKNRPKNWGALQ